MGLAESWRKNFMKDEDKKLPAVTVNSGLTGLQAPLASVTPRSIFSPLSVPTASYQPPVNTAEVDPQFHDALLSAMNKVPAPGLQELLLIMDGLANSLPQNQLCQVALNVVAKKSITLAQIQDELSKRLTALDKENGGFVEAAERQYSVDVGSKESAIASDDQQIAGLGQQITGLQEKIKDLQSHKGKLQEEISTRKQAIENKKGGLAAAHAKLRQDVASLQTRISGGS